MPMEKRPSLEIIYMFVQAIYKMLNEPLSPLASECSNTFYYLLKSEFVRGNKFSN